MPKYQLKQSKRYKEDVLAFRKSGNKLALKKIDTLLKEIADQPRTGTGKPEQLKGYSEREVWSRRISDKHRLVYEI